MFALIHKLLAVATVHWGGGGGGGQPGILDLKSVPALFPPSVSPCLQPRITPVYRTALR